MMLIKRLYSIYCLAVFGGLFLLLLPAFLFLAQKRAWRRSAVWLNHYWAWGFFRLCFISVDLEFKEKLSPKQQYIFCPNHFSFLDIATMGLTPVPFAFVGKNSMAKIPVFGYMYRKLHILVDRDNMRSKYEMLHRSIETLNQGISLTIFPEGGIGTQTPPEMSPFKPGAFKAALENNTPIIPVTIAHNWLFLPDDNKNLLNHRRLKIIYHESIDPSTYSIETINELSNRVFNIIVEELKRWNADEGNQKDLTEDSALSQIGSQGGR